MAHDQLDVLVWGPVGEPLAHNVPLSDGVQRFRTHRNDFNVAKPFDLLPLRNPIDFFTPVSLSPASKPPPETARDVLSLAQNLLCCHGERNVAWHRLVPLLALKLVEFVARFVDGEFGLGVVYRCR